MRINAVIFTHEGDRDMSVVAARALLKAGCHVTMAWDKNAPQWAQQQVPDAEHVITTFDRKRNLNGKECCLGMFAAYTYLRPAADWILKVDSDTIVRPAFIARLKASKFDAEGALAQAGAFREYYGACYALRPAALDKIQKGYATAGILDGPCPEDITLHRALLAGGGTSNRPAALGWVSHDAKGIMRVRDPEAEVMHYGNLLNVPAPHFTVLQRKKYLAARMSEDIAFQP